MSKMPGTSTFSVTETRQPARRQLPRRQRVDDGADLHALAVPCSGPGDDAGRAVRQSRRALRRRRQRSPRRRHARRSALMRLARASQARCATSARAIAPASNADVTSYTSSRQARAFGGPSPPRSIALRLRPGHGELVAAPHEFVAVEMEPQRDRGSRTPSWRSAASRSRGRWRRRSTTHRHEQHDRRHRMERMRVAAPDRAERPLPAEHDDVDGHEGVLQHARQDREGDGLVEVGDEARRPARSASGTRSTGTACGTSDAPRANQLGR